MGINFMFLVCSPKLLGLPSVNMTWRDFTAQVCLMKMWVNEALILVTPDFEKKSDASHMRQGQVYTHMIDVISEYIKDNVQNVSKREYITLLHSDKQTRRSLDVPPISYTRTSTKLHQIPQAIRKWWVHLWLVLSKWGKMQGYQEKAEVYNS